MADNALNKSSFVLKGNEAVADLSIIAANYNNGPYLPDFIESILHSEMLPRELIIVDDGSNDRSAQIIRSWERLACVRSVFLNENKGFAAALNAGLQIARGKYVMRADPDDVFHPARIKKQYDYLERNQDVDILGCNAVYFLDGSEQDRNKTNFPTTHNAIVKTYKKGEHGLLHATVCGKRRVYQNYRYQDLSPGEDYELFARMVLDGCRFASLKEVLYKVRVHPGSSSSKIKKEDIWRTFDFRDRIFTTKTSKRKRWIYFWHIREYRKALLARNPLKKQLHLTASAILYPKKILKRMMRPT